QARLTPPARRKAGADAIALSLTHLGRQSTLGKYAFPACRSEGRLSRLKLASESSLLPEFARRALQIRTSSCKRSEVGKGPAKCDLPRQPWRAGQATSPHPIAA